MPELNVEELKVKAEGLAISAAARIADCIAAEADLVGTLSPKPDEGGYPERGPRALEAYRRLTSCIDAGEKVSARLHEVIADIEALEAHSTPRHPTDG